MTRVLVVTADVLRPQIAGPAMRALHICQRLAEEHHEVRLITTSPYCEVSPQGFTVLAGGPGELAEGEAWCEVMVLQGYVTHHYPVLAISKKVVVFDIYDPLHLETLALTKGHSGPARDDHVRASVETLNHQIERGDFLICASDRQRDLFIGQLCALGRANPLTYDPDPTLRQLIDVVPFGLPDQPPHHGRPVLRGVVPGIHQTDDVLVWAGGIYDWFDPLTLIRAVHGLAKRRPSVRLYFMGLRHPNPDVPPMQMANDALALAEELGVAGRNVFFNEGWVDYAERQNFLLEANVGVSVHFDSAETRFSFRTRALDYLWAGLPIVATKGDAFAELIEREGLGLTVPAEDPEALEEALYRLLSDWETAERCRAQVARVRHRFRWSVVLEPLVAFCRDPRPAPDLTAAHAAPVPNPEPPPVADVAGTHEVPVAAPATANRRSLSDLVRFHYRQGGMTQVVRSAASKAVRLTRRAQPPGPEPAPRPGGPCR